MPTKNMTSLGNFKHRVTLASSRTVSAPDNSDNIVLLRTEVQEVWASINPVKGSFYINGFAIQENRDAFSHYICIRYNRDIDITGYGWMYEDRPSGKRWFKILSVNEMGERQRYWQIQVRMEEKSDEANPPGSALQNDLIKLPNGAIL